MGSKKNIHYVECICDSSEHVMRYVYLDGLSGNTEPDDMYVEVQLSPFHGFFGRVWRAVKYIFGYECKYGHWDCTLMNVYEIKGLIDYLNKYVEKQEDLVADKDLETNEELNK